MSLPCIISEASQAKMTLAHCFPETLRMCVHRSLTGNQNTSLFFWDKFCPKNLEGNFPETTLWFFGSSRKSSQAFGECFKDSNVSWNGFFMALPGSKEYWKRSTLEVGWKAPVTMQATKLILDIKHLPNGPKKCGNSLKFPIKLMRCSILGGWDYWWCKPNSFSVSPDHWDIKCLGDTSRTMVPEVMQKHVQLLPIGNHNPYPCMSLPLFGWYWKTTVTQKGYNFGVGHIPQL